MADIAHAKASRTALWIPLGNRHQRLSNRGWSPRSGRGEMHLGSLLPHSRQNPKTDENADRRLRSLPSLEVRHCAHEVARHPELSLLTRLAAPAALRLRSRQPGNGIDFYSRHHRRAPSQRHSSLAHALPLGSAAALAGSRWLGLARNRRRFADYAHLAARAYADRCRNWLIFNEPSMFVNLGHLSGIHAPGIKDPGHRHAGRRTSSISPRATRSAP